MKKQQAGFTLIELVVVIVILGILAVAATAKFQDLAGEARAAAIQGVAGEVASSSAINYAKGAASGTYPVTVSGCSNAVFNNLVNGSSVFGTAAPARYNVTSSTACAGAGTTVTCSIQDLSDTTLSENATVICTK